MYRFEEILADRQAIRDLLWLVILSSLVKKTDGSCWNLKFHLSGKVLLELTRKNAEQSASLSEVKKVKKMFWK
jgi:hypothetical protein